ncbi:MULTISPECIES: cupin domain-containing protein [Sedimenticola]|uniref:DUF861 domain-containing protein n=1 Tax=Sedimenticola selenatireducens TaxID=191960 RepID=A0A2N6CV72_9GAMM|nr:MULTISPECIES: cupin domain-containing protein [Sedimenticola]MCW8902859.1 cupin domain-containing protein [Sedimenticola sp.]PLX61099.1 MAG: DUF861 domain-containing protein [Sedimenticola selenatireducens]
MQILCEHKASPAKLEILGVFEWPIWEKEVSEFPWQYDRTEVCYFLRGQVEITPDGGEPQTFGRGDLVTLPAGLSCTWKILKRVEKHYSFE